MSGPPYRPSRLILPIYKASADGRWYGPWPTGNAPLIAGNAGVVASGAGGLTTRQPIAAAATGLVTASGTLAGSSVVLTSGRFVYGIGAQANYNNPTVIGFLGDPDWIVMGPFEGQTWSGTINSWGGIVSAARSARTALGFAARAMIHAYYDYMKGGGSPTATTFKPTLVNKIRSNPSWTLRVTFPSGTLKFWDTETGIDFYPGDAVDGGGSGLHLPNWVANYYDALCRTGNANGFLPSGVTLGIADIDGYFSDDMIEAFPSSLLPADWIRSGSSNTGNSTLYNNYRNGQLAIQAVLDTLFPAGTKSINGWGDPSVYPQKVDYANQNLFENAIGDAGCAESFGWASNYVPRITTGLANLKTGAKMNVSCNSVATNGTDQTSGTNPSLWQAEPFQALRYQYIAAKLYQDSNYGANMSATAAEYNILNNSAIWLDEFSWNPSSGVCTTYAARTAASVASRGTYVSGPVDIGNGILRTDFTNCVFLINPPGNGAKTNFPLGGSRNLVRLSGTQASSINNGVAVTPTTLLSMPERAGRCFRGNP